MELLAKPIEFMVNRLGWHWILREWWQYMLDDSRCRDKAVGNDEIFNGKLWWWLADRWETPIRLAAFVFRCHCRARSHPYGIAFYNYAGTEPDMHCNGCGENLG